MKRHRDAADVQAFAVADRLHAAGEILAVAQPHQIEGLLRGQYAAMAGAGMVGMPMGDHGLVDRPGRIDMKAAAAATEAGGGRQQNVFGAHGP